MITIIAINDNDEQVTVKAKSVALLESEEFTCLDITSAEQLAVCLEQNGRDDLAEKVRKLVAHSVLSKS